MLLKVIIAEDNDLFRNRLVNIISSIEEIEIAYSTNNGKDLLSIAKKIRPEIIITDIDMPSMNGIEASKVIREELPNTEIIFITSHEEYIKDAIQLYASDFIEKPLNSDRVFDTIERIKDRCISIDKATCFKIGDSIEFVRTNDLYFVEAMKKKTKVYALGRVFVSDYSMKEVSEILDKDIFYKSSRSHIINLTKVFKIKNCSRTSYEVVFKENEHVAYLSKVNYHEFKNRIEEISGKIM